jgi:hypothetical protein
MIKEGTVRYAPLTALVAITLQACSNPPSGCCAEADGLRLAGEISQRVVALGTTAFITYRVQNLTSDSIILRFTNPCHFYSFITPRGEPATERSAGCFRPDAPLTLPPFGEQLLSEQVWGGAPALMIVPGIPLAPGRYRAYAVLDSTNDRHLTLRSPDVLFEVR